MIFIVIIIISIIAIIVIIIVVVVVTVIIFGNIPYVSLDSMLCAFQRVYFGSKLANGSRIHRPSGLYHSTCFFPQVYASGRLGHARILPLCLKTNYVEHRGKIFSDEAGDDGSKRAVSRAHFGTDAFDFRAGESSDCPVFPFR